MGVEGGDEVARRLAAYRVQIQARAELAMQAVMTALEGWAKSEHGHPGASITRGASEGKDRRYEDHDPPFWDQTGNTTQSIRGELVSEASAQIVRGVLTAGMEYDVFLELAKDGKWAFLMPTIENHKDDILTIITSIMQTGDVSIVEASTPISTGSAYEAAKTDARRKAS